MKVFVSCATKEFRAFRDLLCDHPERWWGAKRGVPQFRSMADPKAAPIPAVDWSVREAASADVLILLLGRRHGALAEEPNARNCRITPERMRQLSKQIEGWQGVESPTRFSYTQWEVLAAMSRGVPILVFSPDINSKDPDLESVAEGEEEPQALRDRQERFCRWVRPQFTEDHFCDRTDLINKVRAALKRQVRRRLIWHILVAAAVVLLLAGASAALAIQRHQARKQLERNLAVAVGASLAMLGQSTGGAGKVLFEQSLGELGLPANQVRELYEEYSRLEQSVRTKQASYDVFLKARDNLRTSVLTRCKVLLGGRLTVYVDFGCNLIHLILVLQNWDLLQCQGGPGSTAAEDLACLQERAGEMDLPGGLAERILAINAAEFARSEGRRAAISVLEEARRHYDMKPD